MPGARAAVVDGLEFASLREVSALGAYGHSPGNCHRDAERMEIMKSVIAPEPFTIVVKMVANKNK